ncbi:Mob1/phocein [Chytriomyces sp. MP71]|nr:Mob1/phocein [Chytriomyces sp. MP71]
MNLWSSSHANILSSTTHSAARIFLRKDFVAASLVKGNFRQIVALPKHMDLNEWLAVNILDFFYYTNLFYEAIAEYCTAQDCPSMSAGSCVSDYMWIDSKGKSVKLPAPQYVDYFMTWTQSILNDQNVFPTKAGEGVDFPRDFQATIRTIYKHLLRVIVHLYAAHVQSVETLNLQSHINTLFAHLLCFGREFELIDRRDLVAAGSVAEFVNELDAMHGLNLSR